MIDKLKFDQHGNISLIKTYQEMNLESDFLYQEYIEDFHLRYEDMAELLKAFDVRELYYHAADSRNTVIGIIDLEGDKILLKYSVRNDDRIIAPNKPDIEKKYSDFSIRKLVRQHFSMYSYDGDFNGDYKAVTDIHIIAPSLTHPVVVALRSTIKEKGIFTPVDSKKGEDDKVFVISPGSNGLELRKYEIPTETYKEDIITDNYNDDFKEAYDRLVEFVTSDDEPGLVLFSGEPGTGKTSIINHLAGRSGELDRKFVLLPSAFIKILSDPSFTEFAIDKMRGAVLCIEDAEDILRNRATNPNSAVTNVLNVTDGILGKISNLKIICTLNNETDVDPALTRKGRLKLKYKFNPLKVEKANALAQKLKKDVTFKEPTILADVYNVEDKVDFNEPEKKKIGF